MISLFKKTDPVCGMKQVKGEGVIDETTGSWFCSNNCKNTYLKKIKALEKKMGKPKRSCCQ